MISQVLINFKRVQKINLMKLRSSCIKLLISTFNENGKFYREQVIIVFQRSGSGKKKKEVTKSRESMDEIQSF